MDQTKNEPQKPFVGILFECCKVYSRVYREPEEKAYHGRCPKCLKAVSLRVDPVKGTSSRQFVAR